MSEETKNPDLEQEQNNEEDESIEETTQEEDSTDDSEKDADYWKSEAMKYKRLSKKNITAKEDTKKPDGDYVPRSDFERLELRQEGYSPEMVDKIMELGGKKALSNEIVKRTVETMVREEQTDNASSVDGPSRSATKMKISKEELESMSSEEMEKHLPKA